jgi:regulatory protein
MMKSSRKPKKFLKEPDSFEHGYNYAIFLLGLSMRTTGEIEFKMKNRGYSTRVIKEVVEKLVTEKYLNDEEYAEVYINNFKSYQTYGLYMIKKKMIERRLPRELIEAKLEELLSQGDELEIAKRYVEKKFPDWKEIKKLPYEERQKFLRKILARGFRMDVALKITGS